MEDTKEKEIYSNLAKLCNHSFGTTGIGNFSNNTVTHNIHFHVVNSELLKFKFQTIAVFSNETMLEDMKQRLQKEGIEMLNIAKKRLIEAYKKEFGKTLKLNLVDNSIEDNLEFTSYHLSASVNRAFYHLSGKISVSVSE